MILRIERSAFGGDGIAFHEGKACFVEGALPGETVEAELVQDKKDFLRCKTARLIESSPQRVEPPCAYYGRCGGCQYQHASYSEELRLKEAQVKEMLGRAGIATPVSPIVRSEKDYGYRNSVTFHVAPSGKKGVSRLCYIAKDNVSKLPVKSCDLLDAPLKAVFNEEFRIPPVDKISFKLSGKGTIVPDSDERFLRVRADGEELIVHSKGFFQNNLAVTDLLCRKVSEWTRLLRPDVFYDLYAGVGTFSIRCAADIPKTVCVEESRYAVQALRMNREERRLRNMEIVEGKVERVFEALWKKDPRGLVFMDPPRQGLEKKLCEFLAGCGAKALVYVSCDIATLARDLKTLLAGGRWNIKEVVPLDMFPRTKHIETAVLMTGI